MAIHLFGGSAATLSYAVFFLHQRQSVILMDSGFKKLATSGELYLDEQFLVPQFSSQLFLVSVAEAPSVLEFVSTSCLSLIDSFPFSQYLSKRVGFNSPKIAATLYRL